MKFLNILRSRKDYKKVEKIIQYNDKKFNKYLNENNRASFLEENGYLILKKNLPENLNKKLKIFFDQRDNFLLPELIILFEFIEKNLIQNIKDYFQGEQVVLANISFPITKFVLDKDSISSSWHTDNMGHKINVHICINGDENISTEYIPSSHKRIYKVHVMNELRHYIKYKFKKKNSIKINLKKNDISIFDSNGLHRGSYNPNFSSRKIIFLEFITNKKFMDLSFINNMQEPNFKLPFRKPKNLDDNKIIPEYLLDKLNKFSFIEKKAFINQDSKYYYPFISF